VGERDEELPSRGSHRVANAYTLAQALALAGKSLTREGIVKALNEKGSMLTGPRLVPVR
jgi:hypothetical protein